MRNGRSWLVWALMVAWALAGGGTAPSTFAQETQPAAEKKTEPAAETETDAKKIEELEQRIRILERLREIEAEKAAEKAKETATVSAGKEGFSFQSADGNFQVRLRGLAQFDGGFFQRDSANRATDTFQITRARPILEATAYKIYDFRITPDFGLGKTVLQDAYLDARFHPAAKMRAGKFKTPFGLERLQSASDLVFVARALPTNLVPNRDIGIQVHGEAFGGTFGYAAGVFNGVPDGGSADADTDDAKDMAARIFFQPFKQTAVSGLQGFGIGFAATSGYEHGKPTATGLAGYKTAGQQTFFTFLTSSTPTALDTVVTDGRRERISPQLYYYLGRFGLMSEFVRSSQTVRIGAVEDTLTNESWQVTTSCFLTGDRASYKLIAPKKSFEPSEGTPGGIEMVARLGRLTIDDDAFPVFANPAVSAREATERAVGVNWYLNRNFRFMVDYSRTSFKGGAVSGDREDENVLLSRLQMSF